MSERIALEELNSELGSARSKYERWAASKVSAASDLRLQHLKTVEENRDRLAALKQEQLTLQQQAERIQSRLAAERQEEEVLQQDVKEAEDEAQQIQRKLQSLQLAVRSEAERQAAREKELTDLRSKAEDSLATQQRAIAVFEKQLGLSFRQSADVSGELCMVFRDINPADPGQEFTLGVKVQPGEEYEVTTCKPELPGIKLLTTELNRSKKFGPFLLEVRKSFCQLCQ